MSVPITADGLTKQYGDLLAVDDVSFTVERGEIFGFLGPNGAGKTTTIRMLLGLLSPSTGRAELFGHSILVEDELIRAKERIGYISGEITFFKDRTGNEFLDYIESVKGGDRRDELAAIFDAPLDRPIGDFSRGNKQKLAFIQAFMHDPDLVIMDEPTSGLDPLMQNRVYEFLGEEKAAGTTVFFSSHILREVQEISDRVCIIRRGQVIALEEVQTLLRRSGKIVRFETAERLDPDDFAFEGIQRKELRDGTGYLVLTENFDLLIRRLNPYTVEDLLVREMTLDDIFIHYYRDELEDEAVDDEWRNDLDGSTLESPGEPEASGRRGDRDA